MRPAAAEHGRLPAAVFAGTLSARVAGGARFAGLFGTALPGDELLVSAHLADGRELDTVETVVPAGADRYPAVTPLVGAAFWYERELHDEFGVVPVGHPRPEPLTLPLAPGEQARPRPGDPGSPEQLDPDEQALARHVAGQGVFTIPHGPVRSGVFESIEYLVETPGEDIPHLNMRVFYKHRGIEKRFEALDVPGGVLLAERAEGIASVAHALAYCHAVERIAGCEPPRAAQLIRVIHAELERVANHLDVALRLADAAGLAVATARFGWHKERVLRLTGQLCGSRFGRGVVIPGGVSGPPQAGPADLAAGIAGLERGIAADSRLLMATASFLDRLRRTGPLSPERAHEHGALGPIGRASGHGEDVRLARPYGAYPSLELEPAEPDGAGDALARLRVRWREVSQSFRLIRQAAGELADAGDLADAGELADAGDLAGAGVLAAACPPADGRAVGWAEAPQGEVLYDVRVAAGSIVRCRPRSASFHNLVLMHEVFAGDILTDFPFIEASFGLSVAGVAQ